MAYVIYDRASTQLKSKTYTFWTWLAVLILTLTFGKTSIKKS